MYNLYGVVEHSGTLHSGHYKAKVRKLSSSEHDQWYHASDAYTREATVDEVHSSQAYLLFYEKTCPPGVEPNN